MNHGGGDAVGVARKYPMLDASRPSITASSHSVSYSPSRGSSIAHENTPIVTVFTLARRISSRSSAQVSRDHCSGL